MSLALFSVFLLYMEEYLSGEIVIGDCDSEFPDCMLFIGGRRTRVEFEVYASNFIRYGHDPEECDLLGERLDWLLVKNVLEVRDMTEKFEEQEMRIFEPYDECLSLRRWAEELLSKHIGIMFLSFCILLEYGGLFCLR